PARPVAGQGRPRRDVRLAGDALAAARPSARRARLADSATHAPRCARTEADPEDPPCAPPADRPVRAAQGGLLGADRAVVARAAARLVGGPAGGAGPAPPGAAGAGCG